MKLQLMPTLVGCIILGCVSLTAKKQKAPTIIIEAARTSEPVDLTDYQFDEVNTRYQVTLPVSIETAKQILVNASAPLGFRFPKRIKDKVKSIARSTDRSIRLDKGLEGQLSLEFEDISSKGAPATRITVDTLSLELVGKKRDHSIAGEIAKHAVALHFLFSDLTSNSKHQILDTDQNSAKGIEIPLYLRHFLNSRIVKEGDLVEFIAREDVLVGNHLLVRKGAPAWGRVSEAKEAILFGFKGKLSIVIESVEAADGNTLLVHADNEELESKIADRRSFPKGYVPPIIYLMAAGGQPNLLAGSKHSVFIN